MSNEKFEEICKKFGIAVKNGKIHHPLFGDVYNDLKKQVEENYANQDPPLFSLCENRRKRGNLNQLNLRLNGHSSSL